MLPQTTGVVAGLPTGYIPACAGGQSYNFGTTVVDLAYGENGSYGYQAGMSGLITFNDANIPGKNPPCPADVRKHRSVASSPLSGSLPAA
jgi:hypothetical protein